MARRVEHRTIDAAVELLIKNGVGIFVSPLLASREFEGGVGIDDAKSRPSCFFLRKIGLLRLHGPILEILTR